MQIELEKIEVGERLRSHLDQDKLRLLANDMERNGQLQEIVAAIKWGTDNRNSTVVESAVLIAGYRRLEAAKLLGWRTIRCTRFLDGDIVPECDVDLLRAEFSENELREDFTEMERVAFGVTIKERVAVIARERMLAGKKFDYEYDPETGYKVWRGDAGSVTDYSAQQPAQALIEDGEEENPVTNSARGLAEGFQYEGGKVNEFVAKKIRMGKDKFRQGEYVLKHGTKEQCAAIDSGETSVFGTYRELRPKSKPVTTIETGSAKPSVPIAMPKPESHKATAKLSEKEKEERAMAMFTPKEREAIERNNAFAVMPPDEKIADLQRQLKEERSRSAVAEAELSRLKDELHNAVYHRDGIIKSLERQLDEASAIIKGFEENAHVTTD